MYNMDTSESTKEPNLNLKTRRVSMYNANNSLRKKIQEQNYEIELVRKTTNNIKTQQWY